MKTISVVLAVIVAMGITTGCGPTEAEKRAAREQESQRQRVENMTSFCLQHDKDYDAKADLCVPSPRLEAEHDARINQWLADRHVSTTTPSENFRVGCDYGYTTDPNTGAIKCNNKPVDVRVVQ